MKKLNIVTAAKYTLKGVDDKFNQAISKWMEGADKIFQTGLADYPGRLEEHLQIMDGKKFAKIAVFREGKPRRVFAFIDKTNGNILKAAGWKAPAKGPRGNLFDEKGGLGRVDQFGMQYNN